MVDGAMGWEPLGVGFPEEVEEIMILGRDEVSEGGFGERGGVEEVRGEEE